MSSVVVTVLAKKNNYNQMSAIIAGPVNLFVMGTGMDLEQGFENGRLTTRSCKEKSNQNQFYKESTLFIFIWNILLLSGFLVAWNYVSDCDIPLAQNVFQIKDWRGKVFLWDDIKE